MKNGDYVLIVCKKFFENRNEENISLTLKENLIKKLENIIKTIKKEVPDDSTLTIIDL